MRIEERRKQLMASSSQQTKEDRQMPHGAGTSEISKTLCNCPAASATTHVGQLNRVVNVPLPFDTHPRLSTSGWTLEEILKQGARFHPVKRFPLRLAKKTNINFDETGIPCIIYDLHRDANWPKHYFNPNWFRKHGPKEIPVRNVYNSIVRTMLLDNFMEQSRKAPTFAHKERLYGEDVKCPERWLELLRQSELIPPFLLPGNDEDLLPPHHVDTFKCHIGIGDTFAPCRLDLCASSGHNLMCYTEGKGSSFWFMTRGKDAPKALKYFEELKRGQKEHVLTLQQLADAPFTIYVAEQKLGDLVLIPPRSCHQVVNSGGLTIKASWSRMVLKGLEAAYYHELPMYRRVCWSEKYDVKSLIYLNLLKRREDLASLTKKPKDQDLPTRKKYKKLLSETEQLLRLFGSLLLEESPPQTRRFHSSGTLGSSKTSSTLTPQLACDYCGANIFQSFFECLKCIPPGPKTLESSNMKSRDSLVICPGCYVEGRSCKCGDMDPNQCRPFQELLAVRNKVAELLSRFEARPISNLEDTPYSSAMQTFRAACLLQKMRRKSKGEERTCFACAVGPGHVVSPWVLECKKCHRRRCFPYILNSEKHHAADALLIHFSNSLHEHYRGSSLQKYIKGEDHFFQTQQLGCKPDPTQQRVRLAERYRRCRPVNPKFVQAGWYDDYVEVLVSNTEIEQDRTKIPQDLPLENVSRSLSPLSELSDSTASDAPAPTLKRKRQVLDCVLLTKRPSQKSISIAAGSDPSDLRGVISGVQLQNVSSSSTPSSDAVEVAREERGQVQPPAPPSLLASVRGHKSSTQSSSQSSASNVMVSSLKSKTSMLLAAKKTKTTWRVTEQPDVPAPPISTRSRSASSTTRDSSEPQQRSQALQGPARIDLESRRILTDGDSTKRREPLRKRVLPKPIRRQSNSTTSTVIGLAEVFNTAAVHNHTAFESADVDPSRSSPAAFGAVRESDQDVMQIDPHRSPLIGRRQHNQSPALLPSTPSSSDTDVQHSTSINSERNAAKAAQHVPTKRRLNPTSPATSSSSERSNQSLEQPQTKVVTSTRKDENNTRQFRSFSIPAALAPSSSITTAKEPRQTMEIREDTRSRQLPPSEPTSCMPEASSHTPLPAPSAVAEMASASSSIVTGTRSVHGVLEPQPPVTNGTVPPHVAPSIRLDGNSLENAIEELRRAISDSPNLPPQVVDAIVALADAMNKFTTQHSQNGQNSLNPPAIPPAWSEGNYLSMFQQAHALSLLWLGADCQRLQQILSQSREIFPYSCHAVPPFDEGYSNSRSSNISDHFPHRVQHYGDGSRMRTNYSYNQQRYQPYERRQDNRNHPFPRHRYNSAQTQDRPLRPMMSDNSRHRVFPSNQGHFSSPRQTSGSEGRSMDGNGRRSESAHLVGSAGAGSTSSSSSALHNPGSGDKSDSAENLNDRIHPHRDYSFRQSPSSITNQPLSSCISTTLSQPSAQQHGEVDSIQSSSHPEPSAETLPGRDGNLPANLISRESGCEQREMAIDDDISQEGDSTSQPINPKHFNDSLIENPWA